MAIEILSHGNCKAAGRWFGSDGGEGNPFPAGASLHAQGISHGHPGSSNLQGTLTLVEQLDFEEFVGFASASGDSPGRARILWNNASTFTLILDPLGVSPEGSIDFIVFRLPKASVPFTPAPPSLPS